jgi:DNA-binding NarL/FixJ family response regulator
MAGEQDRRPLGLKHRTDKHKLPEPRPAVVVISSYVFKRADILEVIRRELADLDILGFATIKGLSLPLGWNVRLIALYTQDAPVNSSNEFGDLAVLKQIFPGTPILFLSHREIDEGISEALARGLKGSRPMEAELEPGADCDPLPVLGITRREAQVLAHLRHGRRNKDIARMLNLSEHTVKMYVRQILHKLQAKNRTEVVLLSQHLGGNASQQESSPGMVLPANPPR